MSGTGNVAMTEETQIPAFVTLTFYQGDANNKENKTYSVSASGKFYGEKQVRGMREALGRDGYNFNHGGPERPH